MKQAKLVLSTGQVFEGELIGIEGISSGELVFTTSMVGYTESLTDPSYYGQTLIFSYPLIGNYGVPETAENADIPAISYEGHKPLVSGVVVSKVSKKQFHWSGKYTLDEWLKKYGITGIAGIDTRKLIQIIRSEKMVLAKIFSVSRETQAMAAPFFDPHTKNLLSEISTLNSIHFGKGKTKIAIIDCGVKFSIIRQLIENKDIQIELVPWNSDLSKIECDAFVISNGPGNPEQNPELIANIKNLLEGTKPILGICLGHQLLALAAGAKVTRLPFGHRSHNQPVINLEDEKCYITSQNHAYAVLDESLKEDWSAWFKNINDQTIEGIKHTSKPFMSVQFHPEASGGPRDTSWIFEKFIEMVKKN